MKYRVLTVNREFGSGGGRIAQTIAGWLGWKLLDRDIIDAIAYAAHVDTNVVRNYDEHVVSWLRRLNQQAMRGAALAAGIELGENSVFDAEEMVKISQKIIEQAWTEGNMRDCWPRRSMCSPAQTRRLPCLCLRTASGSDPAPSQRLERGADIEQRIRTVDGERAKYLQEYFGKNWCNMHLYDLMISSREDEDSTAKVILQAMNGEEAGSRE